MVTDGRQSLIRSFWVRNPKNKIILLDTAATADKPSIGNCYAFCKKTLIYRAARTSVISNK